MNKVFRVIWSEAQGAWVAVSETTKSHSKRSRKAALALALAAGGLMGVTGYASATGLGDHNPSIGVGSIVIGPKADDCSSKAAATGDRSVSIGCEAGAFAEGNKQTNLGYQAGFGSKGDFNTALGSNSGENVKGNNNTAVGLSSGGSVTGNDNLSFGNSAGGSTKGDANVAVGLNAGANLEGSRNASLGQDAGKAVVGDDNAAFGSNAGQAVEGNLNTGFGRSAGKGVQGNSNTSLGNGAGMNQHGNGNLSAGLSAGQGVYGDHNVMLGNQASTVGSDATAKINNTVVIGSKAEAHFDDTVALGSNAKAKHKNSVALGHASQTADAAKVGSAVINTEVDGKTGTFTYSGFAGTASGVVSVGSAGAERQIINVAPGAITSTSTDAVNGSQLYGVAAGLNKRIDESGGGGWILGSKNTGGNSQDLTVAAGKKVTLDAGANMQVTSEQDDDGNTVTTFTTTPDVTHKSVTATDDVGNTSILDGSGLTVGDTTVKKNGVQVGADVSLDNQGLTIKGGPSVTTAGVNAGNLIISNVKAGIAATDGVNVSQLTGLGSVIGGVNIDNTTGAVTGPTFKVNQNSYTTIAGAIEELNKGWEFTAEGKTYKVQADDGVELAAGKNVEITHDGSGKATVQTKDIVEFTDATVSNNLIVKGVTKLGDKFTVNNDNSVNYTGPITEGDHITNKTYVDKISAASKTEIAAGSNVADVAVSTGADGQAIYTVNADGASVSGGSDAVKVVAGTKDSATNITDYAVDLSDKTKTSLKDADSALQTVVTQVDGVDVKSLTKDDNNANFVSGTNIQLSDDGNGGIQVATKDEVTFTQVTTGDSVLNKDGLQVGADVFVTNQGLQAGNTFITNNGLTFNNSTVAVTAAGINAGGQKITNVAAGTELTDGVNFGQLESVKNTAEQGWNVSVNGGTAEQVKPGATVDFEAGNNIQISQNGTEIKIETTPDVEHNKVTTGQSSLDNDGLKVGADVAVTDTGLTAGQTTVDNNGLQVGADVAVTDTGLKAGGTSVTDAGLTFDGSSVAVNKDGINAGGNKITNVAAGTELTDGVNFGQLKDVENKVNQGWDLVSDGKTSNVGAGGQVSIEGGANIKVAHDGAGNLTIATTPDVTHDSVTTGDTVMNDNGVTIKDGPSITKNGVDAGDKKITSVAKGEISETSTDAINGSQLNETNNRVTKNEGDIKNIQNGKDGMFQVSQDYNAPAPEPTGKKSAAGGAGAVASGDNSTAIGNDAKATASNSTALGNSALASANNSVALGQGSVADRANSVSVGTVGGERQITNVAAGVAPTDAVNVSQLDALGSKVNQYFNAANKRIDKVDNNARAGIAAAMAAGTLPQSTLPGKSMVTVGASTYRGESALALGVSRLSDNARTVIKANASADSRGNAGVAVGAGWHW